MNKEFNGNLDGAVRQLEEAKLNLETLWEGGEVRLTQGELIGIANFVEEITKKLGALKAVVDKFDSIALKK